MAKNEIPKHIEELRDLRKKTKAIIHTLHVHHSEAYIQSALKHLIPEGKEEIDYDLLEDTEIQDKFIGSMVDYYVEQANKYFGSNVSQDDRLKIDMLLNSYAGVTQTKLSELVHNLGGDYTLQQHDNQKTEFIKQIAQHVDAASMDHIKKSHLDDLIKEMNIGDLVDKSKMDIQAAKSLYRAWETRKSLSRDDIIKVYRNQGEAPPVYLKPEKKKS